MLDPNLGCKTTGHFDKHRRRPCVQARRAADDHLHGLRAGEVLGRRAGRGAAASAEAGDDVGRVGSRRQAVGQRWIVQHIGQAGQHLQVLVRACGDADHEVDGLTCIPRDASRYLHHGDARAADQLAVLRHAMRDGDAVAEIGVGLLLAAEHAVDVARCNVAVGRQQRPDLADGVFLVPGLGAEADVRGC